jgi:nucleotide-binding universal stress UspA family protein
MASATPKATGVSIRNLLIATDFSRLSSEVLCAGMNFCQAFGAHVSVLYVLPQSEFALAGFEAYAAARDAAQRDMQQLDEHLRSRYSRQPGKDYELLVSEGDVADCIFEVARAKHIDLIVVGTHGRKGLTKALVGSVAEKIFRHADIPVLTVGPNARHIPPSGPKRLLVPVDFTAASKASARYACALGREYGAELILINVIDKPGNGAPADLESIRRGVEQSLTELVHLEADPQGLKVIAKVGPVVPTLLDAASETAADLMIVGVHNYPGLLDHFRQQPAYELVRLAPCPVLTLREPSVGCKGKSERERFCE